MSLRVGACHLLPAPRAEYPDSAPPAGAFRPVFLSDLCWPLDLDWPAIATTLRSVALNTGSAKTASHFGAIVRPANSFRMIAIVVADGRFTISCSQISASNSPLSGDGKTENGV